MKNVEDIYPLSPLQQGILFHSLAAGGEGVYGIQFSCTIAGELEPDAFRQAWREVVARHPILRSAFLWQGLAAPLQVVRQQVEIPWEEADWRDLPPQRRERRLVAEAVAERRRPFELARAPLIRLRLIRVEERRFRFLWTFHHLLLDGWSVRLLLREVLALYVAVQGGTTPRLQLHRPYGDYIAWLQGRDPVASQAFWRGYLSGFGSPTRPDLGPAPAMAGGGESQKELLDRLPRPVTATLRAFARQRRLTLNTVVQGAWALLLGRYSGETDIVFGIVVSGRPAELAGVESMVGLFINTLPLRVRLQPERPVGDWLEEMQAAQLELREHEHSPLAQVQGWSELPRGAALFESVFAFENYPDALTGQEDRAGVEICNVRSSESTHYPLNLLIGPADELIVRVLYDGSRFAPAAVARLAGHLRTLLEAFVADPEAPAGEIAYLTRAERHQVVTAWNDTAAEYDRLALVHELVEAQARERPDAVAASFADRHLTFGELNRRANQLAHHLRSLGVGSGSLVGVCLRRSLEMVPALLAVLKAGAAYVPVEPHLPRERMRYILARLGIRCILLQSEAIPELQELQVGIPALRHLVPLDPLQPADGPGSPLRWALPEIERAPEVNPTIRLDAEAPAYVIFTSGSTGRPKGVMESHRAVVNLIEWASRAFDLGPADRVLFVTALSFDLSVYDIFGLLAVGGSVRIASEEEIRDPERLVAILGAEAVTFWDSAPAALQQLVPFLPEGPVPARLRLVFLSGDWIPVGLPDRIRTTFRTARVVALGGATEATVWSNVYPVAEVQPAWTSIPYGRPIQNASYHVLDGGFLPLPIGVEGDLYIGGECLAVGYATEPALTAERFLPDPFSGRPGTRLYRTGDRARFWPEGILEFRGRRDHQVKIRGFRVELGEIEAVLGQHPAVREAVVLAREDQPGERFLVAYVVPHPGTASRASELRAHAGNRLPDYMVPAAYVTLAEMPVTANGKLDRKALPAPDAAAAEPVRPQEGPRTPTEGVIAGIWSEVLRRDPIGVHDDFFELGGHSLLATQVVARLRQALRVHLPLSAAFEAPTVAALARRAETARWSEQGRELPSFPVARTAPLPLSFAQQRLWFLDQLEPGSAEYNLFIALRISGPLDSGALERSLGELIRRHESLRTTFDQVDGRPRQVVHEAGGLRLPVVDLSAVREATAELRRLGESEANCPFDLETGPLVRALLLRLGDQEHSLLLTLHHIVSDAWSMGILVREMTALYGALRQGHPSPLPELRPQYADFACWQRSWLQGEVLERLLGYWRRRLGGGPTPLDLPPDRPRSPLRSYGGGELTALLPQELVARLRVLGRAEDSTLFMVLLAALKVLLYRRTGQVQVSIGTDAVNRSLPETEPLIGFFVNQLVLRTDLTGNPPFRQLLQRVREGTLEAYDHQDLPFELLVEALQPVRNLGRTPLFQIKLVHQTVPAAAPLLPGFAVSSLDLRQEPARFDLALFATEIGPDLKTAWIYRTDLFERRTIERLAAQYITLLTSVVADPDARLGALEITPLAERAGQATAGSRPQPSFRSIRPRAIRTREG